MSNLTSNTHWGPRVLFLFSYIIMELAGWASTASLQNCKLSFTGVTYQAVSTAYLSFQTTTAINRNLLVFKINYGGVYTSSILSILSNNNATCSLKVNGAGVGTEVTVLANIGTPEFSCNFVGVNLTANAQVNITLSNVRNPPLKNGYLANSFSVATSDNVTQYDSISACGLNDVAVVSYEGVFDVTSKTINQLYANFVVETKLQVTPYFLTNDQIYIDHPSLELTAVGTSFIFQRSTTTKNMTFTITTGAIGLSRIIASTSSQSNYDSDKVKLIMNGFTLKMPTSASPQQIWFKFYRGGIQYMEIYAWITANAAIFTSPDLKVTPVPDKIGYPSNYTFTIDISQPLGPSARILIDLPQEILLTTFSASPSCSFTSVNQNQIQSTVCSVSNAAYKIIQVDINTTSGINAPQNITVVLNNLINPDNPERSYSFGIETYYSQADSLSKVELGASIFSLNLTFRPMVVQLSNVNYTVNQYPSVLTVQYTPGVKIPSNTLVVFQFMKANIISVAYKNVTVVGISYTYTQTITTQLDTTNVTLTVSNDIPANSAVVFSFQFRAPASVSYYDAVKVDVKSTSGILYESKSNYLSIYVASPANEVFSITPTSAMTGVKTSYTFSFFTNVDHPSPFWLSIKFPSDTVVDFTKAQCSPSTVCNTTITNYSVALNVLYLNITKNGTGNSYLITVSNITNSRQMGSTNVFQFKTLTNAGNAIISGSASALISLPNVATCKFDLTKQYYKSNTETVKISVVLINGLKTDDTIQLRFDSRTYSLLNNDPTQVVRCQDPNHMCSVVFYTSSSTVIEVAPTNLTSSPTLSLNIQIYGLISSATTYPIQQFEITVRSYSNNDRQMDEGKLTYNISCRTGTALLNKTCKTCYENATNGSNSYCQSCYTGYYLFNNSTCVTSCASSSTYKAFANSTDCISCLSPCLTCISATQCLSCVADKPLLYENFTCGKSPCDHKFYLFNDTSNNIQRCLSCWSPLCQICTNGSSNGCTDCGLTFLQDGRCFNSCNVATSYVDNSTNKCLLCDLACIGCDGSTNADCHACKPDKVNVSGVCISNCPQYSVKLSTGTCGCEGNCSTCVDISTRCVSCKNASYFIHNYQCIQTCPDSSYQNGQSCVDCQQGCLICTPTTCSQCLDTYYVYENRCYSECNTIGERFAAVNGRCIQCPEGCDLCDAQLNCTVCLTNYTLVGKTCKLTCQLNGNCQKPNLVPDKIIPIPGFITAGVWLLIILILKFFIIKKLYLPYSFIFVSCLIQLILVIVVISKQDATIKSLLSAATSARLLQVSNKTIVLPQTYQYSVVGLLACSLALNYVANFVYLVLFCKYLKKYIPDRQIDKISNYLVVVVGTLLNFRFSLLAYSKMFPKPNILVENQSKLTPVHYMCIASIFTTLFPLIAAGILIYNQYPLTDLFMLGVDLLIIVLLQLIFTILMVSVDKPDDYFEGIKKYAKEEFNQTTEGLNQKQDGINQSKTKLNRQIGMNNSVINIQEINEDQQNKQYHKLGAANNLKSDNQNQPLPNIPIRASHVNLQTMKVVSKNQNSQLDIENSSMEDPKQKKKPAPNLDLNDKQTQRIGRNKTDFKMSKPNDKKIEYHPQQQRGIQSKKKQAPKNFSKQKKAIKNAKKNEQLKININQSRATNNQSIIKAMQQQQSEQIQQQFVDSNDPTLKQANSQIIKRQKKVPKTQTQRSSGILPATMKKRQSFGVFESEKAESSQIDEIDFQTLIQTKMVDKTKDKQKAKTISHEQDRQIQEISPSWFNQQNQRFDIDDKSDP